MARALATTRSWQRRSLRPAAAVRGRAAALALAQVPLWPVAAAYSRVREVAMAATLALNAFPAAVLVMSAAAVVVLAVVLVE
jgi:hypothetical protein